ncbi:MAG TPA: F0F1 ATP synthase subunit delta [Planctomycetota bacterium]|nr:F0F1 ATP synthase subunit delta [Planctomycetota bacterium]
MIEKTLAKRYAKAMLAVALKEGAVEKVEEHLLALKTAYKADTAFRRAMGQPRIPKAARKKLLRKPFEGRTLPAFLELLDLLVDKHRVNLIPDIADSFDQLADESHGVVRVQVATAFPLSAAHEKTLGDRLRAATGKKIEMRVSVDRALKGGISVRIGDQVLDGTVLNRLKNLREKLLDRAAL